VPDTPADPWGDAIDALMASLDGKQDGLTI
jgi:hypothetical protein